MKIGVVGLWHLGEVYSVCLAKLGHTVFGISDDKALIQNFNKNIPPLAEPRLVPLLKKQRRSHKLTYTTDYALLSKCDAVWITHDTPVEKGDKAKTKVIFDELKRILPYLKNNVLLAVSSQLPAGTSQELIKFIKTKRPRLSFEYAYVPENLRLGEAVESFMNPGRIVIGGSSEKANRKLKNIFKALNTSRSGDGSSTVLEPSPLRARRVEFLTMSVASAEMVKHALNSFLATSLSFIYDISDVCEHVGADVLDVSKALKADTRIGNRAYLDASVGFSGGTLGRDLQFLLKKGKENNVHLPLIHAAFEKNKKRKAIVVQHLKKHLKTLRGKRIVFAGITYKSGTPTLRRSLALEIANDIKRQGAQVVLCDPYVLKRVVEKETGHTSFSKNIYSAARGGHAIVIITPWKALHKLNFKKLYAYMKKPNIVFDARNFLAEESNTLKELGFTYSGVGRK